MGGDSNESFSGLLALEHWVLLRRAFLVGEQSFGKGVVQHYFPFQDGSGLKVCAPDSWPIPPNASDDNPNKCSDLCQDKNASSQSKHFTLPN